MAGLVGKERPDAVGASETEVGGIGAGNGGGGDYDGTSRYVADLNGQISGGIFGDGSEIERVGIDADWDKGVRESRQHTHEHYGDEETQLAEHAESS